MLKFCVKQWSKNKDRLEKDIRANLALYNEFSYKDLVVKVVDLIFNDENEDDGWDVWRFDSEKITEIDNGDWQGTLLYLIPRDTYQPAAYEYLMTCVDYGSCGGCDTLQSIQSWCFDELNEEQKEDMVKQFMGLCLHIVQNTIRPYNNGWRKEDEFKHVEE